MFVLDNSVSAAWCFADQSNPYTDAVLRALAEGETAVVPALWRLEIVNSLVVAERRKKLGTRVALSLHDGIQDRQPCQAGEITC